MEKSEYTQIRISQLENNIVEYKKAIEKFRTDAIRYKRYYNLLCQNKEIDICKECDGYSDIEYEPCKNCGASGIIKNKIKWKKKK